MERFLSVWTSSVHGDGRGHWELGVRKEERERDRRGRGREKERERVARGLYIMRRFCTIKICASGILSTDLKGDYNFFIFLKIIY